VNSQARPASISINQIIDGPWAIAWSTLHSKANAQWVLTNKTSALATLVANN
jgi:hypothetical protein